MNTKIYMPWTKPQNIVTMNSFYIPRVNKNLLPYDIKSAIHSIVPSGPRVIRVDIVPIVDAPLSGNAEYDNFAKKMNKLHNSAYVYFDAPIQWKKGTPVHTGLRLYADKPDYFVLHPNQNTIPFTDKSIDDLDQEMLQIKKMIPLIDDSKLCAKEYDMWDHINNCVTFHKMLLSDDVSADELDIYYSNINSIWVSIHQVAHDIQNMHSRVALHVKPKIMSSPILQKIYDYVV